MKAILLPLFMLIFTVQVLAKDEIYTFDYSTSITYRRGFPELNVIKAGLYKKTYDFFKRLSSELEVIPVGDVRKRQDPSITVDDFYIAGQSFRILIFGNLQEVVDNAVKSVIQAKHRRIREFNKFILDHQTLAYQKLLTNLKSGSPEYIVMKLLTDFDSNYEEILEVLSDGVLRSFHNADLAESFLNSVHQMLKKGVPIGKSTYQAILKSLDHPILVDNAVSMVRFLNDKDDLIVNALSRFNNYALMYFPDSLQDVSIPNGLTVLVDEANLSQETLPQLKELSLHIQHRSIFDLALKLYEKMLGEKKALLLALSSPNGFIQMFAAERVRQFKVEPDYLNLLAKVALKSNHRFARVRAVSAIDTILRNNSVEDKVLKTMISKLIEATYDSFYSTRVSAALALGMIGPKASKAIPRLEEMLNDEYPVGMYAQGALDRINS